MSTDDPLTGRILDAATRLAEEGGFDAVRIRDVAARAEVALGTLYKRFQSKDELLLALLEREVNLLERTMAWMSVEGDTYLERCTRFFEPVTRALCGRNNFTRAVLRAVVSGEASLKTKVGSFHERTRGLIARGLRGGVAGGDPQGEARPMTDEELESLAFALSQVWFAALVGWMSGLFDAPEVLEQVSRVARWLIHGIYADADLA